MDKISAQKTCSHLQQLKDSIGQKVHIKNFEHDHDTNGQIAFLLSGVLEEHDNEEFYVRVGEDYMSGAIGVSFYAKHIVDINKNFYGELRILLK